MNLKWEVAYYPLNGRTDFTVEEALAVRQQNAGEYRENPCYNSKESFLEGLGIQLTPCDYSNTNTISHFRAFPGQDDVLKKIASSVGVSASTDAKYTESAIRVKQVIEILLTELADDHIVLESMLLTSVTSGDIPSLYSPDILIRHRGDHWNRETRIFIIDRGRNPQYSDGAQDFFLNITKFSHQSVQSWKAFRPLFMSHWKAAESKMRRKQAAVEADEHTAAAILVYDQIMSEIDSDEASSSALAIFEQQLQLQLDNSVISKSIAIKVREFYLKQNKSGLFIDGNGIARAWDNGFERVSRDEQSSLVRANNEQYSDG